MEEAHDRMVLAEGPIEGLEYDDEDTGVDLDVQSPAVEVAVAIRKVQDNYMAALTLETVANCNPVVLGKDMGPAVVADQEPSAVAESSCTHSA